MLAMTDERDAVTAALCTGWQPWCAARKRNYVPHDEKKPGPRVMGLSFRRQYIAHRL